jgi:hypothetical protein
VIRAESSGLFYATVERRDHVAAGARLGRITDFHGKTLEEVIAPFAGEIMYVVDTPPISKGEPVAMVSASV